MRHAEGEGRDRGLGKPGPGPQVAATARVRFCGNTQVNVGVRSIRSEEGSDPGAKVSGEGDSNAPGKKLKNQFHFSKTILSSPIKNSHGVGVELEGSEGAHAFDST